MPGTGAHAKLHKRKFSRLAVLLYWHVAWTWSKKWSSVYKPIPESDRASGIDWIAFFEVTFRKGKGWAFIVPRALLTAFILQDSTTSADLANIEEKFFRRNFVHESVFREDLRNLMLLFLQSGLRRGADQNPVNMNSNLSNIIYYQTSDFFTQRDLESIFTRSWGRFARPWSRI